MTDYRALRPDWDRDNNLRISNVLPEETAHAWADHILKSPLQSYLQHDEHIRCFMWRCTYPFEQVPDALRDAAHWVQETLPKQLSQLTGLTIGGPQPPSLPLAVFRKGSYLDTHNDYGAGPSLAWVLGLTRDPWTEADGGCLEFMAGPHSDQVLERRLPGFNTLDVYTVHPHARWHRVSLVRQHGHRVTLSSWLPILGTR